MTLKRFIFPSYDDDNGAYSVLLLVVRIFFGIMFLTHGYDKLMVHATMADIFADPFGIGSTISFWMVVFAELVCSNSLKSDDAYANALRAEGIEVIYLVDLTAEALDAGGRTVKKKFLEQFIAEERLRLIELFNTKDKRLSTFTLLRFTKYKKADNEINNKYRRQVGDT